MTSDLNEADNDSGYHRRWGAIILFFTGVALHRQAHPPKGTLAGDAGFGVLALHEVFFSRPKIRIPLYGGWRKSRTTWDCKR